MAGEWSPIRRDNLSPTDGLNPDHAEAARSHRTRERRPGVSVDKHAQSMLRARVEGREPFERCHSGGAASSHAYRQASRPTADVSRGQLSLSRALPRYQRRSAVPRSYLRHPPMVGNRRAAIVGRQQDVVDASLQAKDARMRVLLEGANLGPISLSDDPSADAEGNEQDLGELLRYLLGEGS